MLSQLIVLLMWIIQATMLHIIHKPKSYFLLTRHLSFGIASVKIQLKLLLLRSNLLLCVLQLSSFNPCSANCICLVSLLKVLLTFIATMKQLPRTPFILNLHSRRNTTPLLIIMCKKPWWQVLFELLRRMERPILLMFQPSCCYLK